MTAYKLDSVQESYQRDRMRWAENLLGDLLSREDIGLDLRGKLMTIAMEAELTRYVDDYDPPQTKDALGLSALRGLPDETLKLCLLPFRRLGNTYINQYIKEFEEEIKS